MTKEKVLVGLNMVISGSQETERERESERENKQKFCVKMRDGQYRPAATRAGPSTGGSKHRG